MIDEVLCLSITGIINILQRVKQLLLPLVIASSLLVVFVPLPAQAMDLLLSANITVAVVVLMTTMFVETPLEFSIFPSLLLTTTLGRLVLNIATTRLILTQAADEGVQAAGNIVAGFGRFVAGDNIVVGLVIFAIIVLIQFLVITKGATRISEVAARFALDGMPGRQLAIDADFNAGVITEHEARQRRLDVIEQADFYGAMDGASKFVRGDAVAGVAITFVNILGGLVIGIFQYSMSFSEAVAVFTRLTIGDGLVSQFPALLIAVSAGLLTTRGSRPVAFTREFVRQTLGRPQALWVACGFLVVLSVSHLPTLPLLTLASICGFAGWWRQQKNIDVFQQEASAPPTPSETSDSRPVEDFLAVDPLELEIGVGLIRLADPQRGGDLLDRISRLRNKMAQRVGFIMPKVRIRDNVSLQERDFQINILGTPVQSGTIYPRRVFAIENKKVHGLVDGIPGRDPRTNFPGLWIQPTQAEQAEEIGYELMGPAEVLLEHLAEVSSRLAHELLTQDSVRYLLDQLGKTSSDIVNELIPNVLRLGEVQRVLQELLRERVPIRQLGLILETLGEAATATRDADTLVATVRRRLARTLIQQHTSPDGRMYVFRLDAQLELQLGKQLGEIESQRPKHLVNGRTESLLDPVLREGRRWVAENPQPVLLVPGAMRPTVFRALAANNLDLAVLAYEEIPPEAIVETVAIVDSGTAVAA